jgi:hypothetical protein
MPKLDTSVDVTELRDWLADLTFTQTQRADVAAAMLALGDEAQSLGAVANAVRDRYVEAARASWWRSTARAPALSVVEQNEWRSALVGLVGECFWGVDPDLELLAAFLRDNGRLPGTVMGSDGADDVDERNAWQTLRCIRQAKQRDVIDKNRFWTMLRRRRLATEEMRALEAALGPELWGQVPVPELYIPGDSRRGETCSFPPHAVRLRARGLLPLRGGRKLQRGADAGARAQGAFRECRRTGL